MATYGDFQLPFFGVINNRNLYFPNSKINQPNKPLISIKNIIDPRLPTKNLYKSKFGNLWYPLKNIDSKYNPRTGGYSYGALGPYYATGLGNYPRSMYKEVKFGKNHNKVFIINYGEDFNKKLQNIMKYNSNIGDKIIYAPNFPDLCYISKIIADSSNSNKITLSKWKKCNKNLYFGTKRKYEDPPPKTLGKPNYYSIYEDQDEDEAINTIINYPYSKRGDIITYYPNNQSGIVRTAKIIINPRSNEKMITNWKWEDYEMNFSKKDTRLSTKNKKNSSKKIIYCLPKEKKFPVNSKKRCSAALTYARYSPNPCNIAKCVSKNCKKYPNVGKYSKLMKDCKTKSLKNKK